MNNQDWEDGYENGYKIGLKEGLDTTWHKVNKDGYVIEPVKELTLTHEEYDNIFANGKRLGVIETENRLWKAMQLTDEEIADIAGKTDIFDPKWIYVFARAILRKAQEK